MRRLPPKCKAGKVCCVRTTAKGKRVVTWAKGTTTRGKKNIPFRKERKRRKKGLAALALG